MKYEEIRGDLFGCPETTSLAHCISEDCHMGKGIAVLFKKKFGGVSDLKSQVSQGKTTGNTAVLKRGSCYVYYLITKRVYFHKPTYASLQKSLEDLKTHAVQNGVSNLAMPRIGCGLDGLQWPQVSQMIQDIFSESDMNISIYYL